MRPNPLERTRDELPNLLERTRDELRQAFRSRGLEPYRADQVLRWVYARGERDFAGMTDLSSDLRRELEASWRTRALELASRQASGDGTRKLVLRTADGAEIETVLIPEEGRRTVCVSSQIGCSLDCSFCATGRLGLGRNLRPGEIVDQVLLASAELGSEERATHVVFMGMGEPLLNLESVAQAIRVLCDPGALGLSPRRITVSTAGVIPRMKALGEAALGVRLAVSLHATTDPVRDALVPLNRRFPIRELLEACRTYPSRRRDPISFEYTLIQGVNDSPEDARRLGRLVGGLRAKVNLIALNEHAGTRSRRPSARSVEAFAATLAGAGVPVSVRRSRGADVLAACGQLGARSPGRAEGKGEAAAADTTP